MRARLYELKESKKRKMAQSPTRGRSRRYVVIANYATFTITAIFVLISACAKSAQVSFRTFSSLSSSLDPSLNTGAGSSRTSSEQQFASLAMPENVLSKHNGDENIPSSKEYSVRESQELRQDHHNHRNYRNHQSQQYHRQGNRTTRQQRNQHHRKNLDSDLWLHRYYHHHRNQNNIPQAHDIVNINPIQHTIVSAQVPKHKYRSKYTIEELLNTKFERKISDDIDMDPCKAGMYESHRRSDYIYITILNTYAQIYIHFRRFYGRHSIARN